MKRTEPYLLAHLTLTCDVCAARQSLSAPTMDEVDALAARYGWVRFGPSGSDLCFKCKGASPNTIVRISKCPTRT